jgi:hypothetical protein
VWLDLTEDDLQIAAANGDLTSTSVDNAKGVQCLRELRLVARARTFRQRPRDVGERDAQRVRRSADRQRRRDRSL